MTPQEFEKILQVWDADALRTVRVLEALPKDQYDFRPDPGGRSIGEMAWHLAEGDAYNSLGVVQGGFSPDMRPPGMERPKQVEALAPGYARVHREAVARVRGLKPAELARRVPYFSGEELSGEEILWAMIFHNIHHRGQLCLMCRLAGGVAPGTFGPNREEMAAMQAQGGGPASTPPKAGAGAGSRQG
jgi:uncharacterized damage-inducible protein DinB